MSDFENTLIYSATAAESSEKRCLRLSWCISRKTNRRKNNKTPPLVGSGGSVLMNHFSQTVLNGLARLFEALSDQRGDFVKDFGAVNRHLAQNLSVQLDVGQRQPVDEA